MGWKAQVLTPRVIMTLQGAVLSVKTVLGVGLSAFSYIASFYIYPCKVGTF